jgi:prefoldin subunit 5
MLQETLQNLRSELQQKNEQIRELEKYKPRLSEWKSKSGPYLPQKQDQI